MKTGLIILLTLTLTLPSLATCSIDETTGAACSIAQFEQEKMEPTYSSNKVIKEFTGSPEARLKPGKGIKTSPEIQDFGNQPKDYSYNADCQFGICKNNSGVPRLFQNRKTND